MEWILSLKGGGSRKATSTERILGLHILGFPLFSAKWDNFIYDSNFKKYKTSLLPPISY